MAVAAPAEEAPVLVGLYMTIEAVLTWLLERALLLVWIYTIGAILLGLGNALNYDKRFIHIHLGGPFIRLNNRMHQWLVDQILIQEYAIGWWWHQTTRIQGWIAHEIWAGLRDTLHFGGWLIHTYIPTYVEGVTSLVHTRVRTVVQTTHVIERKVVATERTLTIPHLGEIQWIHRHWKALTAAVTALASIAIAHELPWEGLRRRTRILERELPNILKRLRRVEGLLGATALAAAMANVLGLPNPRCLRSGPIGRVSRWLCRLDRSILDLFLVGTVEALVLSDLCDFAAGVTSLAEAIQPELMAFVDVENALIQCPSADYPGPIAAPTFTPFSSRPAVALASLAA